MQQNLAKEIVQKKIKNYKPVFDENNKIIGITPNQKKYELCLSEENLSKFDYILESMAGGLNKPAIIRALKTKYSIKTTTAENYYRSAMSYWKNQNNEEKEFLRERYELMLMALFQQAVNSGDKREAHHLLKTLISMNGVSEPEKKEMTTKFEFKFNTIQSAPKNITLKSDSDIEFDNIEDEEE